MINQEKPAWDFDFRPPDKTGMYTVDGKDYPFPQFPSALHVPDPRGGWVDGNASVYPRGDEWHVGIYVWRGSVALAVKAEMEKILGFTMHWKEYWGGNGHEGGILVASNVGVETVEGS